jgi:hypothetical protein
MVERKPSTALRHFEGVVGFRSQAVLPRPADDLGVERHAGAVESGASSAKARLTKN